MDVREVISAILHNRNYDKLDIYLEQQETNPHKYLESDVIDLLGWVILEYHPMAIAKLCLFVREFKLNITKDDVLRSIYDSRCAKRYNERCKLDGALLNFCDYDVKYVEEYRDMISSNFE